MGVRQIELAAFVEMALKAGFGRFLWIDDGAGGSAGFDVLAGGAVAAFATEAFGVFALDHDPGVGGRLKAFGNILMALGAGLGADKCRARDPRRRDDGAVGHNARNEQGAPGDNAARDQGDLGIA